MILTQKEFDEAELQAQFAVMEIFEEWRKAFMEGRLPQMTDEETEEMEA